MDACYKTYNNDNVDDSKKEKDREKEMLVYFFRWIIGVI